MGSSSPAPKPDRNVTPRRGIWPGDVTQSRITLGNDSHSVARRFTTQLPSGREGKVAKTHACFFLLAHLDRLALAKSENQTQVGIFLLWRRHLNSATCERDA